VEVFDADGFLAWFFTYFTGDTICPHCQAVIYQDEISEKGDDFVVCPHCAEEIAEMIWKVKFCNTILTHWLLSHS